MKQEQFQFEEPIKLDDGHPVLMPIQLDLLERGRAAYSNGVRRAIWQAPCGSGKTVIAGEQTKRTVANGKTMLHIVHRRRLVDQMIWTLNKFGISAAPIMEGRQRWNSKVYCASRDTLLAMLKNGYDLPKADVIAWDEAHTAAKEVQEWYLKNCADSFWTGYTATPVGADGRSLAPPYQKLVCMAGASELIKIGRLVPVKVYDPKGTQGARKRGESVKPKGDPVEHWKKYALGLPTVVFAARVSDSKAVVQKYIAAGITAEHIDALTPEDERDDIFERSRTSKTMVISNVGVLVEGVDLPWLACCQILRGCNSLVLWCQACGRIMRAFEGKTHGIVLDHSGAVYLFGPPDSDYQWSLEDESANAKKNKLPKDRKPIACPKCSFVYMGKPSCPECGFAIPKKRRQALLESLRGDGILTEHVPGQRATIVKDARTRRWTAILYMGRAKGWTMERCAAVFSREAKCAPWEAGMDVPLPHGRGAWQMSATDWLASTRELHEDPVF